MDLIKKIEGKKSITKKNYFIIIFFLCLIIHLSSSFIGWNNSITDHNSFRQTQTAITAYYTIKEGFTINYITPVLGAPWSIPMEFPLYQWIVSIIVLIFKTPLDQTGRFVSLLFFYLSLLLIYSLLGYPIKNKSHRLIILSFILLNPTYMFWSRTFMIESLALFLSISFLWGTVKALEHKNIVYFIITIIAGTLAGLTKITTFLVFCLPCFIFFIWFWLKEKSSSYDYKVLLKYTLYGIVIFVIPLIFALVWISFGDYQKSLNPMADGFITSNALYDWTFGTFQQKTSMATWNHIFQHTHIINILGETLLGTLKVSNLFILTGILLFLNRKRRTEIILSFPFFLFGPLIFTNLYYVHDYYFYANNLFLSILLGFLIISLLETHSTKLQLIICIIILPLLLFSCYSEYNAVYYPIQKQNNLYAEDISEAIKKSTNEEDILLIYGWDWDPTIPYYSQRKALMDRRDLPLNSSKIQNALKALGNSKVKAMVVRGNRDEVFIEERVKYFNLNPVPITVSEFNLYLAEKSFNISRT